MDKIRVLFTGDCDDTVREMSGSELDILIKHSPTVYIDGNNYFIHDYYYDPVQGEFRFGVLKEE